MTPDDYRRVLQSIRRGPFTPFHRLDDAVARHRPAVALRLDLNAGLTAQARALAQIERETGAESTKCLSLVAAGDLTVCSEGKIRLDPRVETPLRDMVAGPEARFALLNELAEIFLSVMSCPVRACEQVIDQLHLWGFRVDGFATPVTDDPAAQLDLILLHDYRPRLPDHVVAQYGIEAPELKLLWRHRDRNIKDLDFLRRLTVVKRPTEQCLYSRRLGHPLTLRYDVHPVRSLPWLVTSDFDGWRVTDADRRQRRVVQTDQLLNWLPHASERGQIAIVCDPQHFAVRDDGNPVSSIRTLPFPFHHYLAVNSDVDWSTRPQLELIRRRLNEELALPVAGSFYVMAASDLFAAAAVADDRFVGDLTDRARRNIARWFHLGALDTMHGCIDSVFALDLVRDGADWRLPDDAAPVGVHGILVQAQTDLQSARLVAREDPDTLATLSPSMLSERPDENGAYYAYFALPDGLPRGRANVEDWSASVCGLDDPDAVESVRLTAFCPLAADAALQALRRDHVAPLLFTAHGGGFHAQTLASLHTRKAAALRPEHARHDLDRPHSPYYLMPAMRKLGIRFVNPYGAALTPLLTPVSNLVSDLTLADHTGALTFRRFISRRQQTLGFPEYWCYRKNISHPPALGFQIGDVLQRLHWLEPGYGGILYNHLGHNIANQCCDRSPWTEETHQAFERLADYYHGDAHDSPPPFRLWVAPSSSLLLYAAVAGHAAQHVTTEHSAVRITSWHDDALTVDVPDLPRFGTKLLHGLTIYVDHAQNASINVDGRPIDSFSRNPPDETGRESVTIVDDSAPRLLLHQDNLRALRTTGCNAAITDQAVEVSLTAASGEASFDIFPVPLACATHWTFHLSSREIDWLDVAFQDRRGAWYAASPPSGDSSWDLPCPDHRARHVFSLTARRSHLRGFPRGEIITLRLRVKGNADRGWCRLSSVALLRPLPALAPKSCPRILGGRVITDLPANPAGWQVAAAVPGQDERVCHPRSDGAFVFRDLPHDVPVTCRLLIDGRSLSSPRGRVAFTSCDQWDWDFHVTASDLID